MRKPLVVVCAAASAMLLGGVLVATSAGAEETPDMPGVAGWSMPDLSSLFGGDAGFADDSTAVSDADDADDGGDATDLAGSSGTAHAAGTPDAPDTGNAGNAADAANAPDAADRPDVADPVINNDAADVPRKPVLRPRVAPLRQLQPDAQRAAGDDAQRPAQPAAAQQPATGLVAAAKEDVTSADVSDSPGSRVQQQVLVLVNQNRRRSGCGNLSLDRRLIDAANEHAADMARKRYFAHESPNGEGAGDRVHEAGYHWKRYGENIARGVDSAYDVVNGWMHSPEHRENILDCSLHQMGIGLAIAGDRTPYWVQDFATPMT
jgi:uncharacterized protein YkwD